MGHVESSTTASAPVDFAFAFTEDYRNVPKWMLGVQRVEALTEQTTGVGTQLDGTIDVGPKKITVQLEIIGWTENKSLDFDVKGLPGRSTSSWHFEATPDGGTKITAVADWQLNGFAGKALDKILQAFAKVAVGHVKRHLSKEIDEAYAAVGESL